MLSWAVKTETAENTDQGPCQVYWEHTIVGKTIKLRGHPKADDIKFKLKSYKRMN